MPEIKTKLVRFTDEQDEDYYIISPNHTHKDVLRWCLTDLGAPELILLVKQVVKEEENYEEA